MTMRSHTWFSGAASAISQRFFGSFARHAGKIASEPMAVRASERLEFGTWALPRTAPTRGRVGGKTAVPTERVTVLCPAVGEDCLATRFRQYWWRTPDATGMLCSGCGARLPAPSHPRLV